MGAQRGLVLLARAFPFPQGRASWTGRPLLDGSLGLAFLDHGDVSAVSFGANPYAAGTADSCRPTVLTQATVSPSLRTP